ncbi:Hypothetical predicted protein, partial [Marmota monax]
GTSCCIRVDIRAQVHNLRSYLRARSADTTPDPDPTSRPTSTPAKSAASAWSASSSGNVSSAGRTVAERAGPHVPVQRSGEPRCRHL